MFEHIEGKDNILADSLSRIVCIAVSTEWTPTDKQEKALLALPEAIQESNQLSPTHREEILG